MGLLELQSESGTPLRPAGIFITGSRINISDTGIKLHSHHKSIKNLFQEAGIPPWLRDFIPICQLDGELVAIGDWCIAREFAAWLSQHHITLKWHPHNPLLQFIADQHHQ